MYYTQSSGVGHRTESLDGPRPYHILQLSPFQTRGYMDMLEKEVKASPH